MAISLQTLVRTTSAGIGYLRLPPGSSPKRMVEPDDPACRRKNDDGESSKADGPATAPIDRRICRNLVTRFAHGVLSAQGDPIQKLRTPAPHVAGSSTTIR